MSTASEIIEGSDNIFADLRFPNPGLHLKKARLALKISESIEQRGLAQREAAELLQVDQQKISKLMRGVVREFSLEKLQELLAIASI